MPFAKHLKKPFKGFLYLNFAISCGAGLLTLETLYLSGIPISLSLFLMIFGGTLFLYNIQRYFKNIALENEVLSERHLWIRENSTLVLFTSLAGGLTGLTGLLLLPETNLPLILLCGIPSILYSFVWKGMKKGLREIPFAKIYFISFSWALITYLLPLILWHKPLNPFLFLERAIFIFLLCIPFDIRDKNYDPSSLKTLPQVLKNKTLLIISIATASIALLIIQFAFSYSNAFIISCHYIAMIFLISGSIEKKEESYFLFWVDGLTITRPLLILLLS